MEIKDLNKNINNLEYSIEDFDKNIEKLELEYNIEDFNKNKEIIHKDIIYNKYNIYKDIQNFTNLFGKLSNSDRKVLESLINLIHDEMDKMIKEYRVTSNSACLNKILELKDILNDIQTSLVANYPLPKVKNILDRYYNQTLDIPTQRSITSAQNIPTQKPATSAQDNKGEDIGSDIGLTGQTYKAEDMWSPQSWEGKVYEWNRGVIGIDYDGNIEKESLDTDINAHHGDATIRISEKLGVHLSDDHPINPFATAIEANNGGLVIIQTEGNCAFVYLPSNITNEQIEKLNECLQPREGFIFQFTYNGLIYDDDNITYQDIINFAMKVARTENLSQGVSR